MTIVVTRSGKGSALSAGENDGNLDSVCGINEAQTNTTYTVVAADQNRTIECSNASAIAVTLDAIATIAAAIDTSDFDVTIKNVGAGATTITPNVADAIDDGSSTIVLAQYEYVTLQTDSTLAIWNIINSNVDVVLTTGAQAITGVKTMTSPVLNTPDLNSTAISNYAGGASSEETTAAASGATVGFTAVPSWATEAIITFSKVSASAAATVQLRLGTVGGVDTTGDYNTTYHGTALSVATGLTSAVASVFNLGLTGIGSQIISGRIIISKQEGANEWCLSGDLGGVPSFYFFTLTGSKTLSGALTQMQFSLSTGTYDAGNIGVTYR